jgi:hypothetical protein
LKLNLKGKTIQNPQYRIKTMLLRQMEKSLILKTMIASYPKMVKTNKMKRQYNNYNIYHLRSRKKKRNLAANMIIQKENTSMKKNLNNYLVLNTQDIQMHQKKVSVRMSYTRWASHERS